MLADIGTRLGVLPNLSFFVILFFLYSFLGHVLECIVLSIERRVLVAKRGFVKHLPLCIIYGFGSCIGYALLSPFANNWALLFVVGAAAASLLEYITARAQLYFFGSFWWDYSKKPLNFKGILCLESTIGWGVVGFVIVKLLHPFLSGLVANIPQNIAPVVAIALFIAYLSDFIYSARSAISKKRQDVVKLAEEERKL